MKLGAFSVSLNVRDIEVSRAFYETMGFKVFAGGASQKYFIMKNGIALIGLFQGMFEKTLLTFNPGWDENAATIENFDDVRTIQRSLQQKGIPFLMEIDETVSASGPGSIMIEDPDGNQILIDQHV
jgi:predicted lactoylglutathione lyase